MTAKMCRHRASPGMIERRWGRIVNIGSVNARAGRTDLVAYSTATAGLLGRARSLARDSARTASASTPSCPAPSRW
ncbi:SDR family NAD(P)-dependent oxidoreductase [Streptomyces sp. NPDC006632]|uniref:SDR family NAD(P)-dependent oxidoreductase n=1 Tax=unclassified Streptomyces TaxID=2593676 RepID=UPI002E220CAC